MVAGDLHWKVVSVYIHRSGNVSLAYLYIMYMYYIYTHKDGFFCTCEDVSVLVQVMLKMKSRHVGNTFTKKKKSKDT